MKFYLFFSDLKSFSSEAPRCSPKCKSSHSLSIIWFTCSQEPFMDYIWHTGRWSIFGWCLFFKNHPPVKSRRSSRALHLLHSFLALIFDPEAKQPKRRTEEGAATKQDERNNALSAWAAVQLNVCCQARACEHISEVLRIGSAAL